MTVWKALYHFFSDTPNMIVGVLTAAAGYAFAYSLGVSPAVAEIALLGLSAAGLVYHWAGLKELLIDLRAVKIWPEVDHVDLEALDNQIRRERARLITKGLFMIIAVTTVTIPAQAPLMYLATDDSIIWLLCSVVVALDIDAVLDRQSRRRQMELLRRFVSKRIQRREVLERVFQPIFERFANDTSIQGRALVHKINGELQAMVSILETIRYASFDPTVTEAQLKELDCFLDSVTASVHELHDLVRHIAIQESDRIRNIEQELVD